MAAKGTEGARAFLSAAARAAGEAERRLREALWRTAETRRAVAGTDVPAGPPGLTLHIVEDELDGGYVASINELPGCMSQGETQEEAVHNVLNALVEILGADAERRLHADRRRNAHQPHDVRLRVGA